MVLSILVLAGAAACGSTESFGPASAPSPATSTAPSTGECSAVRAVAAAGLPGLEHPPPTVEQQARNAAKYYQQIAQAIQASGATDTCSTTVLHDAEQLTSAEAALAASSPDDGSAATNQPMINAVGKMSSALGQLDTDQFEFDTDCGIPTITPN